MKEDIEFIFVNDCSPDDSIKILQKVIADYPERKAQVRILNNEMNLGPSATRLHGISHARGVYLGFCDADDWVEPTMYESLYYKSQSGSKDIVVANYVEEKTDGAHPFLLHEHKTPQDALACLDDWHQFSWAMWNQIIRRSILEEEIKHIYPTKFREDTYLMMRCYYKASSIAYVGKAYYHYNLQDQNSLIHSRMMTLMGWNEQKENLDRIAQLLLSNPFDYYRFHYAVHCFMFMVKMEYKDVFETERLFYEAYRECHRDAILKESTTATWPQRIGLYLKYNTSWFMYKLI